MIELSGHDPDLGNFSVAHIGQDFIEQFYREVQQKNKLLLWR